DFAHRPARKARACLEQPLDHAIGRRVRMAMRTARLIGERWPAPRVVAAEPLIARLATDREPLAQLRHRPPSRQILADEQPPLIHRATLLPRHPGLRGEVLPMYPDGSVT